MAQKNDELKQIFLSEALEAQEQLNEYFTKLERDHTDQKAVESIFRITHTLKANAEGMGFKGVSEMSHAIEDIFSALRDRKITLDQSMFETLYKANDKLAELIEGIKTEQKVRYIGLKTRLGVVLRDALRGQLDAEDIPADPLPAAESQAPDSESSSNTTTEAPTEETQSPTSAQQDIPAVPEKHSDKATEASEASQDDPAAANKRLDPTNLPADAQVPATAEDGEEPPLQDAATDQEQAINEVTFSDLVQVPVQKLDALLNLVGELIIERDRLVTQSLATFADAGLDYTRLMRVTSELQYSVMNARLVTVSVLFQKFHRIVRDAAVMEGKKVNLTLIGSEIEIDRSVLQTISDSMIHLLRNSVGHGIERPSDRVAKGKPEAGALTVKAYNDKESVVIEVSDDGKGIDAEVIRQKVVEKGILTQEQAALLTDFEIIDFIFKPGFSSAQKVTSLSGRGVGLDVVRKSIDSIGGKVSILTEPEQGTTFRLSLPSSMAVKSVLLFQLQTVTYAVPLTFTESVITIYRKDLHRIASGLISTYLGRTISVIYLSDLFDAANQTSEQPYRPSFRGFEQTPHDQKMYLIIVNIEQKFIGFVVDNVLQQRDIIEKPLRRPLQGSKYFSGASIMGDGSVSLVLDVPSIISTVFRSGVQV